MRVVGSVVLLLAGEAHADRWRAELELGAEFDSNVHRVEAAPDGSQAPVAAPLARGGARIEGAGDRGRRGRFALVGQGQARAVTSDERGEEIAAVALDGRWDHALGARRARAGVRAGWTDASALVEAGARTFTLLSADGVLQLQDDGDRRFSVSAGGRDFTYKPDRDFDWRGAAVGARLATTVWHGAAAGDGLDELADDLGLPDDAEATLELALAWRLEQRRYAGRAFTSGCAPGEPITPTCFVPTAELRGDLHHVAEVEATYTGDLVASAAYQLTVNDSSSYGQSLIRHRLATSATTALPAEAYVTVGLVLQIDQYLDPLLLARDVVSQAFTSIDDENRSAISVRLSRRLGRGVTAEARWAFTADSLSSDDREFRRHVVQAGLTWASDE